MTHDAKRYTGKPRLSLVLELCGLEDVARAMEHGAAKYGRGSWAHGPNPESFYLDAAARHMLAHLSGERTDPESGAPHLAHAAASLLIALSKGRLGLSARDLTFDDRRTAPADAMRAARAYADRAPVIKDRGGGWWQA